MDYFNCKIHLRVHIKSPQLTILALGSELGITTRIPAEQKRCLTSQ